MILVAHRTPLAVDACAALAEAGATLFELDLQVRGSGVVVSHYLPFRPARGRFEHDGWRVRRPGTPDPALPDVLTVVPDGARVLLDPKESDAGGRAELRAALADALPDRARFVVSTSRPDDLGAYRSAGFATWRTIKTRAALQRCLRGGALEDDGVSVRHTLLDAGAVDRLHALTPTVVAWTVNDPARARRLAAWGVDGLTTDRIPALAAAVRS